MRLAYIDFHAQSSIQGSFIIQNVKMWGSYRHFIFLLGLSLIPAKSYCQTGEHASLLKFYFYYPQGSSDILPHFSDNTLELSSLTNYISTTICIDSLSQRRINLIGYCSIEGDYMYNTLLARKRVEVFIDYLRSTYPSLQHTMMNISCVAEDWQGLLDLVKEDAEIPDREEVLSILMNRATSEERKRLLKYVNGGMAYAYMQEKLFPRLRKVVMTATAAHPLLHPERSEGSQPVAVDGNSGKGHSRFSVKTNLPYLVGFTYECKHATTTPNLSIEYFLSPGWSIEAGAKFSNWHYNHRRSFQGISAYRLEPRFYFLQKRHSRNLISPFFGLYGRFGDYNYQLETVNCTGKYTDFGLSGGVHISLYRGWGIEVGARAGYVSSTPTYYQLHEDHYCYDYEASYHKCCITDLNASLVFRF